MFFLVSTQDHCLAKFHSPEALANVHHVHHAHLNLLHLGQYSQPFLSSCSLNHSSYFVHSHSLTHALTATYASSISLQKYCIEKKVGDTSRRLSNIRLPSLTPKSLYLNVQLLQFVQSPLPLRILHAHLRLRRRSAPA
jgi:hypothetical protein